MCRYSLARLSTDDLAPIILQNLLEEAKTVRGGMFLILGVSFCKLISQAEADKMTLRKPFFFPISINIATNVAQKVG